MKELTKEKKISNLKTSWQALQQEKTIKLANHQKLTEKFLEAIEKIEDKLYKLSVPPHIYKQMKYAHKQFEKIAKKCKDIAICYLNGLQINRSLIGDYYFFSEFPETDGKDKQGIVQKLDKPIAIFIKHNHFK